MSKSLELIFSQRYHLKALGIAIVTSICKNKIIAIRVAGTS